MVRSLVASVLNMPNAKTSALCGRRPLFARTGVGYPRYPTTPRIANLVKVNLIQCAMNFPGMPGAGGGVGASNGGMSDQEAAMVKAVGPNTLPPHLIEH